jgi:hypothetical protein
VPSASPRAAIITLAPCAAKTLAIPLPIPFEPPVTITDLPLIDVNM